MPEPRVIFEDTHLAVIDKPAGLLSQGDASGAPNLVDWLRGHFGRHYVGLIHRLDRNTSGVMVVAKRTKSANRLTTALRTGRLRRGYLGWLEGELHGEAEWEHHLRKDRDANRVSARRSPGPDTKTARLRVLPRRRSVYAGTTVTLAEFRLETGRSHQIRAQASATGLPLLGDAKYGSRHPEFGRPALHSFEIVFPHPKTGEELRFESELPADLDLQAPPQPL